MLAILVWIYVNCVAAAWEDLLLTVDQMMTAKFVTGLPLGIADRFLVDVLVLVHVGVVTARQVRLDSTGALGGVHSSQPGWTNYPHLLLDELTFREEDFGKVVPKILVELLFVGDYDFLHAAGVVIINGLHLIE